MPKMTALPHQLEGAAFLAERQAALLADAPRVGKTGTAIIAADDILAAKILVVTTASGRPVWVRGFRDWSGFDLRTEAVYGKLPEHWQDVDRLIVSWSDVAKFSADLSARKWDLLILDESHYAKSVDAKRTKAVYGNFRGAARDWGICDAAARVWCLTGTAIPNAPNDLYPMLRALAPSRINDLQKYEDFLHRYCVTRKKAINPYVRIDVVIGGRNEAELRARMEGFWLRRTQQDVGILEPIYDLLPIHLSDKERREIEAASPDAEEVLLAAETGETRALEMHLGTLRRITGTVKARGVATAVFEELEDNDEKIVLMCWHIDVMELLVAALAKFNPVKVSGDTTPQAREDRVRKFQTDPACRVFVGQIQAAGEAIDLSAAAELIFVEMSFVPKDGQQAALRVTNHSQRRQPRVRVAALEGSVDEAVQGVLLRKLKSNREVMK